jgi:hypothetical protein
MNVFDDGRQGITAIPPVTAEFCGGQKQEGPEPLATAADQVVDDLRDETHFRPEMHLHVFLNPLQIVSVIAKDILYLHGIDSRSQKLVSYYNRGAHKCQMIDLHQTNEPRRFTERIMRESPSVICQRFITGKPDCKGVMFAILPFDDR